MSSVSELKVKFAKTPEEKEKVYRFRYQVYVEEMGKNPSAADPVKKWIMDPELDDTSSILYIEHDSEMVATIRLTCFNETIAPASLSKNYGFDKFKPHPEKVFGLTSRLMVAEKWRGTPALQILFASGYEHARKKGVLFDFCHCRPSLIPLYEKIGYRRYTNNFVDEDAGYQVPMVFLTADTRHMEKINSPFLWLAEPFPKHPEMNEWFDHTFPMHRLLSKERGMTSQDFWDYLNDKASQEKTSISLFKGLTDQEAQKFIKVGTVLRCKAGDLVIRAGDAGFEMFVLLSGHVEVRVPDPSGEYSVAQFGPGQGFGEMSFLAKMKRTANVIAMTDLEVLVLSQHFFQTVMNTIPEITIKVLYNLSLMLCDRLRTVTLNWLGNVKAKP